MSHMKRMRVRQKHRGSVKATRGVYASPWRGFAVRKVIGPVHVTRDVLESVGITKMRRRHGPFSRFLRMLGARV